MPEMTDDIAYTGDPIPKRLSDANRAKLDGIVKQMISNRESDAAIQAVVGDFKSKYSEIPPQQAFQVQISNPTNTPMPAPTTGTRTFSDEGQFGLLKLQKKATEAKAYLDKELQGNDHQYEKEIREYRSNAFTMDDLKKDAKDKGYIIPIGQENAYLKSAKQKQYDRPVTPDDISDIKMGTILNRGASRKFINKISSPETKEAAYRIDAYNHASQDPDGEQRAAKIEDNAKRIKKGEYNYDPVSKRLTKPQGFVNSVFQGRKDLNESFDFYDLLKNGTDKQVLEYLNKSIAGDADEPEHVPENGFAGVGRMIGGQPVKGLIAGGIASLGVTAVGNPEAAGAAFNVANAGVSGVDMYKIGKANAVKANYAQFKQQGLPDWEALEKAKSLAEDQANTDAAMAVAMNLAAAKIGFKPSPAALGALKASLGTSLLKMGEETGKKALEGVGVGAIGGVGQIVKNLQAQHAGLPVDTFSGFKEQVDTGVLLTLGMHTIAKVAGGLRPDNLRKLTQALSKFPPEQVEQNIKDQLEAGQITPQEADKARETMKTAFDLNTLVPEHLPETDKLKIGAKIRERNLLKDQLEKVDEAYHPEIKDKIKALNEEIINLTKGSERGELQSLVAKEIEAGNVHEWARDYLQHADEKELESYMEAIAEYANDPTTHEGTLAGFGKKIVEKAKELYPKGSGRKYTVKDWKTGNTDVISIDVPELGTMELTKKGENSYSVSDVNLKKELRGRGLGKELYHIAIDVLHKRGLSLEPGHSTSPRALRVWKSLEKEGLANIKSVKENTHPDYPGDYVIDAIANKSLKPQKDATSIRSDEGQVSLGGNEPVSGKNQGGEDIQLGAGTQGEPGDQSLGGGTPQESQSPGQEKVNANPSDVGITHAQMDAISKDLGLSTYEADPETVSQWDAQARERFAKDPDALSKLITKLRNGEGVDKVETRMMIMHMADLMARYEKNPSRELLNEINRTKNLYNISGREKGKELVARKGSMPVAENLAQFHQQDTEWNNNVPLTDEQIAKSTKEYEAIKAKEAQYDAAKEGLTEKGNQAAAEETVAGMKKTVKKSKSKNYAEERAQIYKDIQDKLKKARSETGVYLVPYAKELIAITPDVLRYARSLVEQGVEKLPELISEIHGQLRNYIPDIKEKDVRDVLAGVYTNKKTRNEISEKLFDLRLQAKLINKLEALEAGKPPADEKAKRKRSAEVEELRRKIKDFENNSLHGLKEKYKKQIQELERQLNSGDFSKKERKPIELDDEAKELRDQLFKLRQEREIRLIKMKYASQPKFNKYKDAVINVVNAPRTIMSSMDYSAPLRQGLVASIANPDLAAKAFVRMFKMSASEKDFDSWYNDLRDSTDYHEIIDSGLSLTDPHDPLMKAHEEAFLSNLPEKIPIGGRLIKSSERAYVGFLNKMRVDSFRRLTDAFKADGKTFANSPELYKAAAEYINTTTGRGKMVKMLEDSAPILNALFFSPRLIAARVKFLTNWANPAFYKNVPKEIRIQYAKDMIKFVVAGSTVLGLAKWAGAQVEADPRSTDFGKIKVGNTRWDIWGGFQQYVRVMAQMFGKKKSAESGEITELNGEGPFGETRGDVLARFGRGKLAPVPATAWDFLSGRTVTGDKILYNFNKPEDREINIYQELGKDVVPLLWQDVYEAWKDHGWSSILTAGVPASFGVGVQTFGDKKQ